MSQTEQQYYGNEENFGSYQYVLLSTVIDNLLLDATEEDSFIKNASPALIRKYARQGLKELSFGFQNEIKGIEILIGNDLQMILPQDFVSLKSISAIDNNNNLRLLSQNKYINISKRLSKDAAGELTFDSNGKAQRIDDKNAYNTPYNGEVLLANEGHGFFGIDSTKITNGDFKVDKRRGMIVFSSNLKNRSIVIEYTSDGLEESSLNGADISLHKYLEAPLSDWIYYACIRRRRNVPANRIQEALLRFKTTRHQAKILFANLNFAEVSRVVRSKKKW